MIHLVVRRAKWWWRAAGKGNKTAPIPVNQEMTAAHKRCRTFIGLSPLPDPEETTSLVPSIGGIRGITSDMLYQIVKSVLLRAADALEPTNPHNAQKLRRGSTHWLRHTKVTQQTDAGIELRYVNRSPRHTSLESTTLYLHLEDVTWHEAMEMHKLQKPNRGPEAKYKSLLEDVCLPNGQFCLVFGVSFAWPDARPARSGRRRRRFSSSSYFA